MKLTAPTKKPITLRPLRPNAGLHAAYRKRIMALVQEMQDSLDYWLRAAYNAGEDPAMDSSEFVRKMARLPAKLMQEAMSRMVARWQKRFDEAAPKMATWFLQQQKTYTDGTMQKILKDGGFSVEMVMTPAMHNVVQASIAENVSLIKSIGSQHLTRIEGLVMRATLAGRDIGPLAKELQAQYGVTQRRAAFIARDQANKVTSQLASARQQELGITQGRWRHSGAGAEPRPEHVAASGKLFDLKKGMLLEGEWVLPGQAVRCRCSWSPIIPGLED